MPMEARRDVDADAQLEPMLGSVAGRRQLCDDGTHRRLSHQFPGKENRRRSGSKDNTLFIVIALLCGLTILGLPCFFFASIFSESTSLPEHEENNAGLPTPLDDAVGQQDGHDHGLDPPQPGKNASPSKQLDLETGFVISNEPVTRDFVFNVTRQMAAPDGFGKSMILVNGQSPGPLIEANTGDTVRVVVHNGMPDASTTIHWHGIDQRNTTWMDGVFGVSQCGIPPGESFTYEFTLSNQRGTFWYHSHFSVQYTDGLYGPMIIHDPDEKVPEADDDKIIMIGDLYHRDGEELLADYLSTSPSWSPKGPGMEPPPDNLIINGQHESNCTAHADLEDDGNDKMSPRHSSESKNQEKHCTSGSLWSTRVRRNDRVRLRLISHSTNVPYYFTIDNHTLEIVEMDGVEIDPIATTRVFMNPGQRYSVLVKANQTAGNYLMRASAATSCFHLAHGNMHGGDEQNAGAGIAEVDFEATSIFSYDDTSMDETALGLPWDVESESNDGVGDEPWDAKCHDLPFDVARPVRSRAAYEVGKRNHHYFGYEMKMVDQVWRTVINDTIYSPLKDDATLWSVLRQNATSRDGIDTDMSTWDFGPKQRVLVSPDESAVAQVVINSNHMMSHPWHLHADTFETGQNFQVVGWGKGSYGTGETTWNLENPIRRDTVTVPGFSHLVIRIAADNPGIWALHCHILWHAEGGMFISVAQRMTELRDLLGSLDASSSVEDVVKQKFCFAGPRAPALASGSGPASAFETEGVVRESSLERVA